MTLQYKWVFHMPENNDVSTYSAISVSHWFRKSQFSSEVRLSPALSVQIMTASSSCSVCADQLSEPVVLGQF